MNAMNALLRDGLNHALGALHRLADAGCTALSIVVEGRNPVVQIERPSSEFLLASGAIKTRVTINGQRRTTYVARVGGVQVEWIADERLPEVARASG